MFNFYLHLLLRQHIYNRQKNIMYIHTRVHYLKNTVRKASYLVSRNSHARIYVRT